MALGHAHFQKFCKFSKGFLEEVFIWPFDLISYGFSFPHFKFLFEIFT